MSKITTFTAFKSETDGKFWDDFLSLDRLMIESNWCPKCFRSLTYLGKSKPNEYRAYGVCEPCDIARLFWAEKVEVAEFKKKICAGFAK